MRIGLDGRYIRDDFPGIGRYVCNLAWALPAVAPDIEFFLLQNPDAPNTRYDIEALRQPNLTLVSADTPIRSVSEQIHLPRLARQLSLDVFHAPYYITAYRTPCQLVITIYDAISARYPEYLPSLAMRVIFEVTTRLALQVADQILTLSDASRQDLVNLYHTDPDRVTVTPLAAGPRFQSVDPRTVDELKRRLNLPDRYVLYVGVNKPHKNLVRLTEAWAQVTASGNKGYHLVVAGREDPRYPQAREHVAMSGLGNVMFLGEVGEEDLPALYSGAELFVFPSLYEGFGLPVIEAMACGTPVACSNVSSLPEVAGDAAVLFDPHTPESIATAIRRLLSDTELRDQLRQRSVVQAGRFSWRRTAQLTLEAYKQRQSRARV